MDREKKVTLSVIMPVYNCASTIERALKSVLHQKSDDMEVLVIDGGSSDGTVEIIENYAKEIDYFVPEKDRGYADALNKGIAAARGTFFTMLAGDDCYLKDALKTVLERLDDGVDVWCGSIIEKRKFGYVILPSSPDFRELYRCCSLRQPASMYRRSVVMDSGCYDIRYRCSSDRDLFLRLYEKNYRFRIEALPVVLFGTDGMSTTSDLGLKEDVEISVKHGMDPKEAERIYLESRNDLIGTRRMAKENLYAALNRLHLLDLFHALTKRPKGYLHASGFELQQ